MVVISDGGSLKLKIPYESFKQDYEPFGWKIIEDKRIDKNEQKEKEATETIVEDKEIKIKK